MAEAAESGGDGDAQSKYEERMKRLRGLHVRRNEARKLNHAEVVEEDRRNKLPANYEAKRRRQQWQLDDLEQRKAAEDEGDDFERAKMLEVQADFAERADAAKRRKRNTDRGFASYEQMTQRQHDRLTKQFEPDLQTYSQLRAVIPKEEFFPTADTIIQGSHYPDKGAIDGMVADLEKQVDKRKRYHRRRAFDPDAQIDYINERNRHFNAKVERYYNKYTDEIKQNLERGTAV